MLKHTRRYLATATVATAAGLAALGGMTAASASPVARPAARATVSAAVSGTEHFQLITTSATSNSARVITYGAFTAPAVDIMGSTTDTFKIAGGSFQIKHGPGHGKQSFNPRTCLSNINERGNYTLGHGTGKYAGISGHGTYHLIVLLIAARSSKGRCSQTKLPLAFQQIITGSGPVHL